LPYMLTSSKRFFSLVLKNQYLRLQAPALSRAFSQFDDKNKTKERRDTSYPATSTRIEPMSEGPTPEDYVRMVPSLSDFMVKIYRTTGLTIGSYLGVSYLLSGTALAVTNPGAMVVGGLVASLGGIFAFNAIPQVIKEKTLENGKIFQSVENPPSRLLAFAAIIGGNTIALTPLVTMMNVVSPTIVPAAAAAALMIMGGSSLYAMKQPVGKFSAWRSGLFGGLIGLLGMNLMSMLSYAVWGPNFFTLMAMRLDTYFGIGLFTALQIFDTHQAIEDYQAGNTDHLRHTINFYLNFANLFIRLARYFSEFFSDQ